jgi:glycosyltransferase involved in cell wall biosynthesis
MHLAADLLELAYRLLSRRSRVVVVGPGLARLYSHARDLLQLSVSLIDDRDIADEDVVEARSYEGELQVLSIGRLDREKNPLLLADVLARLDERDGRWRLLVCGEAPMARELSERLAALGIATKAELRGYVPIDDGLLDLYRNSHVFLHVSWTEGLPQVLFEAFAARLPVVATAVGGVPERAGDAALLVPPGDLEAAVAAPGRVAQDSSLRSRLIESGLARVREHTLEAECRRLAQFLRGQVKTAGG